MLKYRMGMRARSIKIDERLYRRLKELCHKEKRTISGQLEYILEMYLKIKRGQKQNSV